MPISDLDDWIQQAATYVVASDSLRSRTLYSIQRRRSQRQHCRAAAITTAVGLLMAWLPFHLADSKLGERTERFRKSFTSSSSNLRRETFQAFGSHGTDLEWALHDAVAERHSARRRQ